MQNQYRLGIDAGGTFTDFILADRKGEVRIFKALSTPNKSHACHPQWSEADRGRNRNLSTRDRVEFRPVH